MTSIDAMPEVEYHAHRALSASSAKKLLPPYCPAIFKWEKDNPPERKAVFEFGSAAHSLVLGAGPELVDVGPDDWRGKHKEAVEAIRDTGAIPLKSKDFETVHAMAEALRSHRLAAALLSNGKPEQSLFWTDAETGIDLRARLDWLPNPIGKPYVIGDYKTAESASPDRFSRALHDYGYDIQAAWYQEAVWACEIHPHPEFVFIVQAKNPPYLVSVFEPDAEALDIGRRRMRQAIDIYAECLRTDTWPAYTDGVQPISVTPWVANQYAEDMVI